MKILLVAVNAKYIHSNLAIYSLKAAAQPYSEQIETAEYTINQRMDEILGDIYRKQPDVVAFSCYIWNRSLTGALMDELPRILPETRLWAGGPEVSYDAGAFLTEHPGVTGVMRGEGEQIFRELSAFYIEGKKSLAQIPGLTFREKEGTLTETPAAPCPDLNRLPFAYEDLGVLKHKIIYYESSRGCPFSCSYCLSSIDKGVRYKELDQVKQELSLFLKAKVPQVKFVDRTFNCHPARTAGLWRFIMEQDNGVTNFHFEVAADLMTEEELALMSRMRPGLIQLEAGIQSVNPDTLKAIGRSMDLERLKENVKKIKSFRNIHQHLDLIAGLPKEDIRSFQHSFDEVFRMKPEQLQLGFLKVLKGTRIQKEAAKYRIRCHHAPPYEVFSTHCLSYGELLLLKSVEEMVEVYYNSQQFTRTLEKILERYKSPFDFFRELGIYYEEEGKDKVSHSRMARYEILRAFLKKKGWADPVFDQCMVCDLYAREDLKSRPSFAADPGKYKETLREYARIYGKQVHIEVFERKDGPVFVLFDYQKRNPLTKEAWMQVLPYEREGKK
ncbi:MAG TPA: B12-binding domain-containing radical SAM protein [Lachnospiraceae bacterium]|nr:B12-binding domain-containing radical SAM protein [Lachnospiraceae bacterium]